MLENTAFNHAVEQPDNNKQQTHIQHVHHSLLDGSVNRTIHMSAQSLSLSVKMFLHHCQSSFGTIKNVRKQCLPIKTTVLNAARQLVDPLYLHTASDSSCFYICVFIPCAKITILLQHPQKTYNVKPHTHAQVGLEW